MPSSREQVFDLVKEIVELSSLNLRLCITIRPEVDIRRLLEPLTSLRVFLHEQTGQRQDIVNYWNIWRHIQVSRSGLNRSLMWGDAT